MFDYDPAKEKEPTDYTGLKIVAILGPVFFLFAYLGKPDVGLTVVIVLGMIVLAIKLHWRMRNHAWFWATIALVLALHVPILFVVRWPGPDSKAPTLIYSMPFGLADFLIISGALKLAEKAFSTDRR